MDVRCEKCQTEYELDEARLKPGGVTVKCTNCGHMFKIRKRTNTNVGVPTIVQASPSGPQPIDRPRTPSGIPMRADSILGIAVPEERQWLLRLENGEQKSCRELANLQQWIVSGVVTRESLISRTGKTWKRLGDIAELAQYFVIADEARTQRQVKNTGRSKEGQSTMLGIGGGTIVPDDASLDGRSTGNFPARPRTTPPPVPAQTQAAARRPATQPPPPPGSARKAQTQSQSGPLPAPQQGARGGPVPASNRSTAAWATEGVSPSDAGEQAGPAGPFGGRIKAASVEPAFAGRVRVMPGDESSFKTGQVESVDDDDDDVLPARRGSRGGGWLLVMALLVMGAAAGVVYVFVIRKGTTEEGAKPPPDAAAVAVVADAAVVTPPPALDAAVVVTPVPSPLELVRAELGADLELKLRDALKSLDGSTEPGAEAVRAHLASQIAQGLLDRASVTTDKAEAEKLKKDAKTIVIDAATLAQRAFKAAPDDAAANLAMADVLRMQGKPLKDVKRYLDTAKAKAAPEWKRDVALGNGLVFARDAKLEDAKAAFAAIDTGDDKLEASGDVRARFHLALVAYAQNKPADAKTLVDQVLAAQPEHSGAKALAARIETTVVKSDPLPPEDGTNAGSTKPTGPGPGPDVSAGGGTYDSLLAKANKLAETNCAKASELFGKALELKPNGVEALTGMGYCHIDAKQYASAFSKFRAALAVSSRYEPALWGIAEAYSQQGRKEQAIESVKAYLEVYPNTPKALRALDRLGASAGSATTPTPEKPPEGSGSAPPTPAPAPAPAENGAGSGSG